jgi:hypothetical protein
MMTPSRPGPVRDAIARVIRAIGKPFTHEEVCQYVTTHRIPGVKLQTVSPTLTRMVESEWLSTEAFRGKFKTIYRYTVTSKFPKQLGVASVTAEAPANQGYAGRVLGFVDSRKRGVATHVIAAETHVTHQFITRMLTALVAAGMLSITKDKRYVKTDTWDLARAIEMVKSSLLPAPSEFHSMPVAARHMTGTEGMISMEDIQNLPRYKAESEALRALESVLVDVQDRIGKILNS